MPVVVTGADGPVGRALVPLLTPKGEVRAVVGSRSAAEPLRAVGAKVAVTPLERADTLEFVLDGAHNVCHLVDALDVDDDAYERENGSPEGHQEEDAVGQDECPLFHRCPCGRSVVGT